jgi:hypothetical protein
MKIKQTSTCIRLQVVPVRRIKTCWREGVQPTNLFLVSAVCGKSSRYPLSTNIPGPGIYMHPISHSRRFMPEGRANFTHSIRKYMALRDDLATAVARKKFLSLKRNKPRPFSPWPEKYMTESSFFKWDAGLWLRNGACNNIFS